VVITPSESGVQRTFYRGFFRVDRGVVVRVLAAVDFGAATEDFEAIDEPVLSFRQIGIESSQSRLLKSHADRRGMGPAVCGVTRVARHIACGGNNGCNPECGEQKAPPQ